MSATFYQMYLEVISSFCVSAFTILSLAISILATLLFFFKFFHLLIPSCSSKFNRSIACYEISGTQTPSFHPHPLQIQVRFLNQLITCSSATHHTQPTMHCIYNRLCVCLCCQTLRSQSKNLNLLYDVCYQNRKLINPGRVN